MVTVDKIALIRRAHFGDGKKIKEIVRELAVSRKVVRKVVRGAVAMAVGNRGRRLRRDDGTASGGEVNHALGRRLTEARPAIDLAHADLAGGEQGPEQHGCGLRRGQHGLRLDAPLELFMQPLNGVRGPCRLPLA